MFCPSVTNVTEKMEAPNFEEFDKKNHGDKIKYVILGNLEIKKKIWGEFDRNKVNHRNIWENLAEEVAKERGAA